MSAATPASPARRTAGRAHRAPGPIPLLLRAQAQSRRHGFSMIELLIAVVIVTVSIGALAVLSSRQWASTKDIGVLDRVENTVALDLGWIKTFAKYWKMSDGPYNLCPDGFNYAANDNTCSSPTNPPLSGTTSYTLETKDIIYEPDPNENTCPNPNSSPAVGDTVLSTAFVTAASTSTITPTRPFTVQTGDTTLIDSATDGGRPALPSGTTLVRNITVGKNLIFITYSFSGTNAAPYRFVRRVAVHPEAAAFCP